MTADRGEPPFPFGLVGPPWWSDRAVFLVGGGPSLAGFDFSRLADFGYILGINQSMLDAPCQAGVSLDHLFVTYRRAELCEFAKSTPLYLALGDIWWRAAAPIPGAIYLRDSDIPAPAVAPGLSRKPDAVYRGATSGYVALGLATLKRAKRIVLLGYDYAVNASKHHYHDAYFWHQAANDQSIDKWAQQFKSAAAACAEIGIEVINASPLSAIDAFPKMSIEDALTWSCHKRSC